MKQIYFTEFRGVINFMSTSKQLFDDHKKVIKSNREYYLTTGRLKKDFEEVDAHTKDYVMTPDEFYDYLEKKDQYYLKNLGYDEDYCFENLRYTEEN